MRNLLGSLWFVAVLAAPAASQDDPAATVKKAIEAHGGAAALNKAKVAKSLSKGTMNVGNGQKVEYTATALYSLPDKYKFELTGELAKLKLVTTQVLNGKKAKVRAMLGGTEQPYNDKLDKVKDETIQAALVQEASLLTPLVEGKKYTLKADKDADVNGSPAAVVVVTGNGLREVRFFFDKKTHQLVKMHRKGLAQGAAGLAEIDEETLLSDFKKFDAALLPTKVVVTHDKKEYLSMTVTELKFLDKVDAAEFPVDD